jgi:cation transport regulator ChaC
MFSGRAIISLTAFCGRICNLSSTDELGGIVDDQQRGLLCYGIAYRIRSRRAEKTIARKMAAALK